MKYFLVLTTTLFLLIQSSGAQNQFEIQAKLSTLKSKVDSLLDEGTKRTATIDSISKADDLYILGIKTTNHRSVIIEFSVKTEIYLKIALEHHQRFQLYDVDVSHISVYLLDPLNKEKAMCYSTLKCPETEKEALSILSTWVNEVLK